MKIVAVIPAHLASIRFPRKVMYRFQGVPMIEHVRRRALMCKGLDAVYVATGDPEIADMVSQYGGEVLMTAQPHLNGTSRVAEAVQALDASHVVLLQADEPLLLPRHIDMMVADMRSRPEGHAWNVTGPIAQESELDRHSFVKCVATAEGRILICFRRSPLYSEYEIQRTLIRKILGIIGYQRDLLPAIAGLQPTALETAESIEQMRIIEHGYELFSVPVAESLPSVNEPHEVSYVEDRVIGDSEQHELLRKVLGR